MVKPFDEQPGIEKVVSGYTGGHTENPTYEEVCSETTGHREAVQITFNPDVFPYEKLLELFWQQIDPTDAGGNLLIAAVPIAQPFFIIMINKRSLRKLPSNVWLKAASLKIRL